MTWVAVGVAGASLVGGVVQGQNTKKGQAKAQAAQEEAARVSRANALQDADTQYGKNWDSQMKAQEINQGAYDKQLQANRANQTSDFGSTAWAQDPTTGAWTQTNSVDAGVKPALDKLRGNYSGQLDAMETDFNVNNDVMQAMRAQSAPQMEQQRNKENARLAAMGLSTGSGSAWGASQDALNRSDNDMEQKNILGGFNAWNSTQANNRANLGASSALESSFQGNAQQPSYAQAGAATVGAPTWNMGGVDDGSGAFQQQIDYGNAQNANIGNVASGIGSAISAYGAQKKPAATGMPGAVTKTQNPDGTVTNTIIER
jgi:hypothetical protein